MNEDWIKAGKIAGEAREFGKGLIKEGAKLLEITEKVEAKIKELGGEMAFPAQLSRNEIAAHYNAAYNDQTILGKDLVKLDVGVNINGAIGDTAVTVDLSGENEKLVNASREALQEAIKIIKPGLEIREIGKVIQEKIQSYDFSPIRNLSGHGLNIYKIHDKPTIPNYDNNDSTKLVVGQTFAIEPFATTGVGAVMDSKPSEIYRLINKKPVRDFKTRKILDFIEKNYKELPFAKRWLVKEFDLFKVNMALASLEKIRVLHQYEQLVEKNKGLVSQAEHSVMVTEDGVKVLTDI